MLVLSRRIGEKIIIPLSALGDLKLEDNDKIVITVIECNQKNKARLGFEARKEVPIHREEVFIAIEKEKEEEEKEGEEGPPEVEESP